MRGIRVSAIDRETILAVYLAEGYYAARPLADRLGLSSGYVNALARRLGYKGNPGNSGECNKTHGKSHTREHSIWRQIIARCENPNIRNFGNYGGRGISICAEWRNDFATFYRDMGPSPSASHSIDRINSNGNYEPSNCRWATIMEQANNRRTNRKVTYRGTVMSLTDAMRASGCTISFYGVCGRLHKGWDLERALHEPAWLRVAPRSHCPAGHALSGYNLTLTKHGYRRCRACAVERNQNRRLKRAA